MADIRVALELDPGPALALVVDRDLFAVERLGLERRVRRGEAAERRACFDDLRRPSIRIARSRDKTAQTGGREVWTGGGQTRVEFGKGA